MAMDKKDEVLLRTVLNALEDVMCELDQPEAVDLISSAVDRKLALAKTLIEHELEDIGNDKAEQ